MTRKILLIALVWLGVCLVPIVLFSLFVPAPWNDFAADFGMAVGGAAMIITLQIKPIDEWRRSPSTAPRGRAWLKSGR
jgi:hypothetical protein